MHLLVLDQDPVNLTTISILTLQPPPDTQVRTRQAFQRPVRIEHRTKLLTKSFPRDGATCGRKGRVEGKPPSGTNSCRPTSIPIRSNWLGSCYVVLRTFESATEAEAPQLITDTAILPHEEGWASTTWVEAPLGALSG